VIADVVFDLPVSRPFSYAIPRGMELHRGQRVSAPLRGRARTGMVVDLRYGDEAALQAIARPVDGVPVLSGAALELGRWAADESFSSWGSTLLALSPPPARRSAEVIAPPAELHPLPAPPAELWVGGQRDARLAERLRGAAGSALVIAPDREGAARWAERLDAARLDSGAPDAARRAAWFAAARGRARIVVGTRSALLVPLPPPATLVLLDEHDPAHKPPGAPRLHSRELLARRASLEGSRLLMLSATPSVESWWRAQSGRAIREHAGTEKWPEIVTADTRGILRNHPLTLPLTRAIEEATRRGRRAALVVTRRAATLVCAECGAFLRCAECGVPLPFSRARKMLACRWCARSLALPDRCPACGGHRLSPFGWDGERVEAAVQKRFPTLTVSRTDPRAHVFIGPPGIFRAIASASLGCVGVVALDSLLGMPDFRGGERAFELLWAAASAVGGGGRVIVQTLHPEHYAVHAARRQDLSSFYEQEIKLRAELGYPPFRRLCVLSVRSRSESDARALIADCARALGEIPALTVYPPAPRSATATPSLRWQLVIKGPAELPRLIAPALSPLLERRRRGGNVIEIEMDPVS
jgi:primosomal protein N' (replication factor Y) (superfamily II helicase)